MSEKGEQVSGSKADVLVVLPQMGSGEGNQWVREASSSTIPVMQRPLTRLRTIGRQRSPGSRNRRKALGERVS